MARGLARAGADVTLWGRSEDKLAKAAADIGRFAGRVATRTVDVSDEQAVTDGVAALVDDFGGPYVASKAAVLALANGCAVEFARHRIRVNSVLPGRIATDMTGPLQESDVFNSNVIGRVPIGRWGTPEDFEGIAVYLASDASSFQTGSTTLIDGGYSMF